jgi:hypothetical protein
MHAVLVRVKVRRSCRDSLREKIGHVEGVIVSCLSSLLPLSEPSLLLNNVSSHSSSSSSSLLLLLPSRAAVARLNAKTMGM